MLDGLAQLVALDGGAGTPVPVDAEGTGEPAWQPPPLVVADGLVVGFLVVVGTLVGVLPGDEALTGDLVGAGMPGDVLVAVGGGVVVGAVLGGRLAPFRAMSELPLLW